MYSSEAIPIFKDAYKYIGKWAALNQKMELIVASKYLKVVMRNAKKKGVKKPIVLRVPPHYYI